MRTAVCSLFFLAAASLAEAQHSSVGPGQSTDVPSSIGPGETTCKNFSNREDVLLTRVRPALELAMRGGKVVYGGGVGYVTPMAWQNVQMLGDGTSVGVLKAVSPKDLTKPEFVNAYLQVIRIVFSEPKWAVCPEDKTPAVTLFLLDYLREKVTDEELKRQIDSTREYVVKQAGSPQQSPFPDPSESAK
jgi:hypothetical protein